MNEQKIIDFSDLPKSLRHGRYGGQAGDKDGVIFNNECWIVKYPKTTQYMDGEELNPYTTAPLSEYIGSHIYSILGYDVHETELVYRNNQIAVACKDFQKHFGDLAEIRSIKNSANEEIYEYTKQKLPYSATGDCVNFEELLFHFKVNPLMNREDLIERFWDCIVVDIFIDNNDRNNGNWGLLFNEETNQYDVAPIYDNGNCFNNKISDEKIRKYLQNPNENLFVGTRTIYEYQNHILSSKKMLNFQDENMQKAILRVVPKINENYDKIVDLIKNIPNEYQGISVCSEDRKQFYIQALNTRLEVLLKPSLSKYIVIENDELKNEEDVADDFSDRTDDL